MAVRVTITEHSLIAKIAAKKLRCSRMAVTLGSRIFLYNAGRASFLASPQWVNHELKHVLQFRKYGFVRFLLLYLLESVRKGYYHNRFEREARAAEAGPDLRPLFEFD